MLKPRTVAASAGIKFRATPRGFGLHAVTRQEKSGHSEGWAEKATESKIECRKKLVASLPGSQKQARVYRKPRKLSDHTQWAASVAGNRMSQMSKGQ
jgi:hypothetical protein